MSANPTSIIGIFVFNTIKEKKKKKADQPANWKPFNTK